MTTVPDSEKPLESQGGCFTPATGRGRRQRIASPITRGATSASGIDRRASYKVV
jgi:hypothetical protein